ncbi:MAG: hypothetical protein AAFX00_06630 [Pseudomonadota bacterium]
MLKHLTLAVALVASPALAEDENRFREGMDLLSEGTRLLLEGLISEMEPALEGLGEVLNSLDAYHPPEVLPNGDIILRRKEPLEEPAPEGEIEI